MHNLKHLKRVPIEIVFGQNKIVIFRATNTSTIKEGQRFRIRFKLEQEIISGQRIYGTFEVIKILGQDDEFKQTYGGDLPKFEVERIGN